MNIFKIITRIKYKFNHTALIKKNLEDLICGLQFFFFFFPSLYKIKLKEKEKEERNSHFFNFSSLMLRKLLLISIKFRPKHGWILDVRRLEYIF